MSLITSEDRFWSHVRRATDAECWPWTAAIHRTGYGQALMGSRPNRRNIQAHRAAWIYTHGDIPTGLLVCHTCDVRECCNPSHLFLGTNEDNIQDMLAKGRSVGKKPGRSGRTLNRHIVGGKRKITEEMARQILDEYAAGGTSERLLGMKFGVTSMAIHYVRRFPQNYLNP